MFREFLVLGALAVSLCATGQGADEPTPFRVGMYLQQAAVSYREGLPSTDVRDIAIDREGRVSALTAAGSAVLGEGGFAAAKVDSGLFDTPLLTDGVPAPPVDPDTIRGAASHDGESAVAADSGLYVYDGRAWSVALPRQGAVRWAPLDVRVVAYDAAGRLWFGCPQGVGYRVADDDWRLFTGSEGLPFNDFTAIAASPDGSVWFGTTNGAIRFADGTWEFRHGPRWLAGNEVRAIAIDDRNSAWFATDGGVSQIEFRPMTLAEKAKRFEDAIDRYNRRTEFGYVGPADLARPGDLSTATPRATDNDGQFTSMYLAAVSWAYAATGLPEFKERARRAFEAVAFLGRVTEGSVPPAQPGYAARCIVPADGPNPNDVYSPERDRRIREVRDENWRIMDPRWPMDASGKWYWLSDLSTDELNGHFFGAAVYFDEVCETEPEREAVRAVVRRLADHLIVNNHTLIDYDGSPTRWGRFSPDELNRSAEWTPERGLNSMSALMYMGAAHHVTGDEKYRKEYLWLAWDEGYAMNAATHAKYQSGPGSFGQGDDTKAFLHYYFLLRYETDPELRSMYLNAIHQHWQIEKYEDNPFFNFVYAAACTGQVRANAFYTLDLTPPSWWLERSVDTLKRFPLDLVNWPISNAHRLDMRPLPDHVRERGDVENLGFRFDGRVFPIDERPLVFLGGMGDDPWILSAASGGTQLRDGLRFLFPYYMGLAHGFIAAE